jgi:hypothetical protein
MSYPKKDPEVRMVGVAGCVTQEVKDKLIYEANKRGVRIGPLVGEILTEWAEGKERGGGVDPNQMRLEGVG